MNKYKWYTKEEIENFKNFLKITKQIPRELLIDTIARQKKCIERQDNLLIKARFALQGGKNDQILKEIEKETNKTMI